MKIILLQDVKSLGKKGDVVEVNNGYARNYVLPQKLGVEANNKNMNDLKLHNANEEKVAEEKLLAAKELGALIESKEVVVKMKSGEGGKTFGTISSKEIAKAAADQIDITVDKKKIQISEPIKSLGVHMVSVKLHPQVTAKLTVKVQEE